MSFIEFFKEIATEAVVVMDAKIPFRQYTPIDFSVHNSAITHLDITNPVICQSYIDVVLRKNNATVAYGGYLEKRNLYNNNQNFEEHSQLSRNIHLGVDFWTKAGTKVQTPLPGKVHSFKNNAIKGDYGPTIILVHEYEEYTFHSLYGHLSLESLNGLYEGMQFNAGDVIGSLGTPDVNLNYAPHLHFQIIKNMDGYFGDYPGVCTEKEQSFYEKNCPDPNSILSFH